MFKKEREWFDAWLGSDKTQNPIRTTPTAVPGRVALPNDNSAKHPSGHKNGRLQPNSSITRNGTVDPIPAQTAQ
jgi:hypothetical protein